MAEKVISEAPALATKLLQKLDLRDFCPSGHFRTRSSNRRRALGFILTSNQRRALAPRKRRAEYWDIVAMNMKSQITNGKRFITTSFGNNSQHPTTLAVVPRQALK